PRRGRRAGVRLRDRRSGRRLRARLAPRHPGGRLGEAGAVDRLWGRGPQGVTRMPGTGGSAADSGELGPEDVVRQWTSEVIHSSYVAMGRPDVEAFLAECVDELLLVLDGGPVGAARGIGERLVGVHLTNSAALARTLRILATELPRIREIDPVRLIE